MGARLNMANRSLLAIRIIFSFKEIESKERGAREEPRVHKKRDKYRRKLGEMVSGLSVMSWSFLKKALGLSGLTVQAHWVVRVIVVHDQDALAMAKCFVR